MSVSRQGLCRRLSEGTLSSLRLLVDWRLSTPVADSSFELMLVPSIYLLLCCIGHSKSWEQQASFDQAAYVFISSKDLTRSVSMISRATRHNTSLQVAYLRLTARTTSTDLPSLTRRWYLRWLALLDGYVKFHTYAFQLCWGTRRFPKDGNKVIIP